MTETSDSALVSTRQRRIAQLAKQMPEKGLTSLNQHLDLAWLREAYRRTRKDGAAGVDGQTAADDEKDLKDNLRSLLERAKSGTYCAPPVRRVHIPKSARSETRPIGIPTLEDKSLQRAIVMLLEPIYEEDFYDCSYGFRPQCSAHDALASFSKQTMWSGVCCVLEVDIRKSFDTLDHAHLRAFLQHRIRDGVVLRLIEKWLNAGVMNRVGLDTIVTEDYNEIEARLDHSGGRHGYSGLDRFGRVLNELSNRGTHYGS
jgi:RNA-directed DNA polymerase